MTWVNLLGAYLAAGTVFYGIGWMVRSAWTRAGKMEPIRGKHRWLAIFLGTVIGVLFWPVVLAMITIGWSMRRKTKRMERFLGFCEHHTILEPYCGRCKRELDRESARFNSPKMADLPRVSDDALERLLRSSVLEADSFYYCADCGIRGQGFPPAARDDGRPVCSYCDSARRRTQK